MPDGEGRIQLYLRLIQSKMLNNMQPFKEQEEHNPLWIKNCDYSGE